MTEDGKSVRPGRNEKCPCGSGKKYRHCCKGRARDPFGKKGADIENKSKDRIDASVVVGPFGRPKDLRLATRILGSDEMTRSGPSEKPSRVHPRERCEANRSHIKDERIKRLRVNLERLRSLEELSTQDIEEGLASFDVHFDERSFIQQAQGRISCMDVAHDYYLSQDHSAEGADVDLIWRSIEELWKRLMPERYTIELLADAITDGYTALEKDKTSKALSCWERAWEMMRTFRTSEITSLDSLEERIRYITDPDLRRWILDFMEQLGMGRKDRTVHLQARLALCSEMISMFPDAEPSDMALMLTLEAESMALLGKPEEADALFSKAVIKFPLESNLYFGWGDIYGNPFWTDLPHELDTEKAKRIYLQGRKAVPEDSDMFNERLEMLDILVRSESLARKSTKPIHRKER